MSRQTKTNVDPITTHERRKALAADLEAYLASGKTIEFPGYLRAYVEGADDPEAGQRSKTTRPSTIV